MSNELDFYKKYKEYFYNFDEIKEGMIFYRCLNIKSAINGTMEYCTINKIKHIEGHYGMEHHIQYSYILNKKSKQKINVNCVYMKINERYKNINSNNIGNIAYGIVIDNSSVTFFYFSRVPRIINDEIINKYGNIINKLINEDEEIKKIYNNLAETNLFNKKNYSKIYNRSLNEPINNLSNNGMFIKKEGGSKKKKVKKVTKTKKSLKKVLKTKKPLKKVPKTKKPLKKVSKKM